jgi:hypothetical protein
MLNPGSGVFVGISAKIPMSFAGISHQIILKIGLVPYVYRGLNVIQSGQTSHIHNEALIEFTKCQALFLVLECEPQIANKADWSLGLLPLAIKRSMATHCYMVANSDASRQAEKTQPIKKILNLPESIPTKIVFSVDEFERLLNSDLKDLLRLQDLN